MSDFWFGVTVFILPFLVVMLYEVIKERGYNQGYKARDAEIQTSQDVWQDVYDDKYEW